MKMISHATYQPTKYNKKATMDSYTLAHLGASFIGVKKAAHILGISTSTLRRWIKASQVDAEYRRLDGSRGVRSLLEKQFGKPERAYLVIPCSELINLLEGYGSLSAKIAR